MGVGFYTRRLEDFRREVPAQKPPCGAVSAGTDVTLVASHELVGGQGFGAV